jgi:hypothetical protein
VEPLRSEGRRTKKKGNSDAACSFLRASGRDKSILVAFKNRIAPAFSCSHAEPKLSCHRPAVYVDWTGIRRFGWFRNTKFKLSARLMRGCLLPCLIALYHFSYHPGKSKGQHSGASTSASSLKQVQFLSSDKSIVGVCRSLRPLGPRSAVLSCECACVQCCAHLGTHPSADQTHRCVWCWAAGSRALWARCSMLVLCLSAGVTSTRICV